MSESDGVNGDGTTPSPSAPPAPPAAASSAPAEPHAAATPSAPATPPANPHDTPRSTTLPKVIALLGLLTMLVLAGFEFQALTWESGDRVLHLNYASVAAGLVTTVAAIVWAVRSRAKAGAIVVAVVSILINPIWLLLLIRLLG